MLLNSAKGFKSYWGGLAKLAVRLIDCVFLGNKAKH